MYSFGYRSWELRSYSQNDLLDIISPSLRVDVLNSSIVRILPRFNDSVKDFNGWLTDKMRFGYDSFQKQRLLSVKILTKSALNDVFYISISLSVAFLQLKEDFFKLSFRPFFDFVLGNFFDLRLLFFFRKFFTLFGPVNYISNNLPTNFLTDLRSDYILSEKQKDDLFAVSDFFILLGLNLRFVSPNIYSRLKLEKRTRNIFISLFSSPFNKSRIYDYNFGSQFLNFLQFLRGKHFLSRLVILSKGLVFFTSKRFLSFKSSLIKEDLKIKKSFFLVPSYLSSLSYFEVGLFSFETSKKFQSVLFCLNDYDSSFLSSSLNYSLKIFFSFSEALNNNLGLNFFFDYIFPFLSPFEEKTVYIDFFGNVIKTGGGLYDGHIASSVLGMEDFFFDFIFYFF